MSNLVDTSELMFNSWEPKTKNRFIFYVEGIPSFLIKTANRPSPTSGEVVIDHINVQRKVKGKSTWGDVTITMYDAITPSAAQAAMEWFRMSHESVTGRDGYADMYKKDCSIVILGPTGDKVEEWTLKGAWPKEVTMGDLDWSAEDVMDVSVNLSIDYAILQY